MALHLWRGVGCQLWCVLQQDIAYRLCNPFIVEFLYFFGHMDGGTKHKCDNVDRSRKIVSIFKTIVAAAYNSG